MSRVFLCGLFSFRLTASTVLYEVYSVNSFVTGLASMLLFPGLSVCHVRALCLNGRRYRHRHFFAYDSLSHTWMYQLLSQSVLYRPHDDCTCYYVTWQHAGSEAYRYLKQMTIEESLVLRQNTLHRAVSLRQHGYCLLLMKSFLAHCCLRYVYKYSVCCL